MSSLYKLQISGVRLFSPKDHETIQFGLPLTLICGQNGCGKTTIIESLKYATTGDLPPNSKGGAFVNDPVIADRLVVNAEIKLGFVSVDGKLMTVTRNMQLNRKRATRGAALAANTFKSLEGQMAVVTRGEKTAISTKNAELDTRVPLYLGALKAVLEYVIFCHQDDSLWPLSEAGVLKKRFDEIFEALKFTKVLDTLKTIRKDMAADIRVVEQGVLHAKLDKARAQKIKERLASLVATADTYLAEIAELTMAIEAREHQANELFHSNQAFQQTISEHARIRLLVESTRGAVHKLEASITLLREPDETLRAMAANFEQIKLEKAASLGKVRAASRELEASWGRLQDEMHVLVREEGSLATRKQEYQANLAGLRQLKQRLFSGESGSETQSNDEVKTRLSEQQQYLAETFDRVVAENSAKRETQSARLSAAADDLRKERERLAYCREEIAATARKISDAKGNLASVSANEESLEIERSHLESLRLKIDRKRSAHDAGVSAAQIEQDNQSVQRLELELEELMRKINSANKQLDLLSKIDYLRESQQMKQDVLGKFIATHSSEFSRLFGVDIDPSTAEGIVEAERKRVFGEQSVLAEKTSSLQTAAQKLENDVHSTEKATASLKAKYEKHAKRVLAVLTGSEIPEYETLVQELEEDYKTAVYNLNTFEVTKSYKTKAMELAKSSKCCALCNRGMDQNELQTFLRDIANNLATVTADKLTTDVENTSKDLHEMKSINIDVLEYRRLQNEITKLEEELKETGSRCKEAKAEYELSRGLAHKSKTNLESIVALAKPVSDIVRMSNELTHLTSQLAELDDELKSLGVSSISMNELQKLQQQKNFEIKNLRQSVADATQELNMQQKEVSRLELQLKEKELLISNLQLSLSESTALKHQVIELEEHEITLVESTNEMEVNIDEFQDQHLIEKVEFDKIEKECTRTERAAKDSLDRAKEELEVFTKLFGQVSHFEQIDSELVTQNETKMTETKRQIENISASRKAKENDIQELQNFINDAANTERNIRDNLELRDTEQQLQEQENALADLNIEDAESEKEAYQEKSKKIRDQIAGLNEQHYGKVGEMKQIKDQVQGLQHELETDFQNVDQHYHNEWIKLQTNLLVSTDLQTYSLALDKAIMKYHSIKMDEINRILRELWTQTYRGTDIDGVEIKCDVSNQVKGRSYNYRVVMYKKNSELDMRGRCSAGQKVLTSILIRLALAECFGSNCGMIALDEPTTNLDVENAESLANALSNIIELRKSQKNFQLIVITHDEKFLNHINGDRFVDNFYRIERDELQHSIIKSLPIHVMQNE